MHRQLTRQRPLMPYHLLFPLASLFAATVVPFWLVLRLQYPALSVASWHGHEMLFGYTLAVIAGFLATRKSPLTAWILATTWLAARLAALTGGGVPAVIAGVSFPLAVFLITVPPLLSAAKRAENRVLPALLTALIAADIMWWAGMAWPGSGLQTGALLVAVDLIALLLLLVGGRALRAAVGGFVEKKGLTRHDRSQRHYELPLAALLGAAAMLDAVSLGPVAGALCLAAAVLTLMRVIPWQLQHTLSQPSLWSLALGYLWLVPGLAFKGIAQLGGSMAITDMLHGIGIGALGTLTLVMMARTLLLRTHKSMKNFSDIGSAALLISAAACARLIIPLLPPAQISLLWLASIAWSCAFLLLLIRLLNTIRTSR